MVDAPKCKVCGSSHFGSAHVWRERLPAPPSRPAAVSASAFTVLAEKEAEIAALMARVAELEADAAKTVRRRERQRDLMRARRAGR